MTWSEWIINIWYTPFIPVGDGYNCEPQWNCFPKTPTLKVWCQREVWELSARLSRLYSLRPPRVSNSVSCNFETGLIRVVSKLKVRHDADRCGGTNGRAEGLIGEYDPWSEIEHCCGWTVASQLLRMARWFTEYDLLVKFMILCRYCMMRGCMYILHEWVYGGTNHSISLAVPGWQTDNAAGEQRSRSTGRGA